MPGLGLELPLLPVTYTPPGSSARTEQLTASVLGPKRTVIGPMPAPMDVSGARTHGIAANDGPSVNVAMIVVPDGVAQVRVDALRLTLQPVKTTPAHIKPMTATVHENVAGFRFGPLVSSTTGSTHVEPRGAVAQMTWLDAHGRVIARPTVRLGLWVFFRPSTPPRQHAQELRLLPAEPRSLLSTQATPHLRRCIDRGAMDLC